MFLLNFTLTYLACISLGITVAAFDELLNIQNFKFFGKRQGDAYRSTTTQCGIGATCEASCGPGYTLCGSDAQFLCYNPSAGDTCCVPGAGNAWSCDASGFCLIDGYCCPNGDDSTTCAQANGVTLPANFSNSTWTSSAYNYVMSSFTDSIATAYSIAAASTAGSYASLSSHIAASPQTKTNHTSSYIIHSTAPRTSHALTMSSATEKATATVTIPWSRGTLNGTFFTPTASATSIAAFTGGASAESAFSVMGLVCILAGLTAKNYFL